MKVVPEPSASEHHVLVAQWIRALPCGGRGRWFESSRGHYLIASCRNAISGTAPPGVLSIGTEHRPRAPWLSPAHTAAHQSVDLVPVPHVSRPITGSSGWRFRAGAWGACQESAPTKTALILASRHGMNSLVGRMNPASRDRRRRNNGTERIGTGILFIGFGNRMAGCFSFRRRWPAAHGDSRIDPVLFTRPRIHPGAKRPAIS